LKSILHVQRAYVKAFLLCVPCVEFFIRFDKRSINEPTDEPSQDLPLLAGRLQRIPICVASGIAKSLMPKLNQDQQMMLLNRF
jgi:hypothetical protein